MRRVVKKLPSEVHFMKMVKKLLRKIQLSEI